MKTNLLLTGPIGCGKSTMIRNALGKDAMKAGGYVTLRLHENGVLQGFDLAPASAWRNPESLRKARAFLRFEGKIRRDSRTFSDFGATLLREALQKPYAVCDEFGGLELLVPEFHEALTDLLQSEIPCIGVFKSPRASQELQSRLGLDRTYQQIYELFFNLLSQDSNTRILETTGRYDLEAQKTVEDWVSYHVRK